MGFCLSRAFFSCHCSFVIIMFLPRCNLCAAFFVFVRNVADLCDLCALFASSLWWFLTATPMKRTPRDLEARRYVEHFQDFTCAWERGSLVFSPSLFLWATIPFLDSAAVLLSATFPLQLSSQLSLGFLALRSPSHFSITADSIKSVGALWRCTS